MSTITTTNATDAYGNLYTTTVSGNDELENSDFITLMLTELSMQDPTAPVDSSSMLDDQLSMQTLETNLSLSESMESLSTTFEQSALSTSASLIGNIIENGNTDANGNNIQYQVSSVEGQDGTIYLTAYQMTDYYDVYTFEETNNSSNIIESENEDDSLTVTDSSGESYSISTNGKTYAEVAEELSTIDGITASMVENTSGNEQLVISISGGSSNFSQNGTSFSYSKDNATAYSNEAEIISYTDITKIY